jgi:two-component system phosphate regulon sensor histidine kinase PhoR
LKVRHRLLRRLAAVALVGTALMALGSIALVRDAVRERFVERLRAETALLAELIDPLLAHHDPQDLAVSAGARLGARVTLVDAEGLVLGDSSLDVAGLAALDNHLERPEIAAARLGGQGECVRRSATTNAEYYYVARRVEGDGPVQYVRLAMPSTDVSRVQRRYTILVLAVLPAAMLLLTAIGYAAARRLSRPVEAMADAVQRSAGGDLRLELPDGGGEEIERLGRAVSLMRRTLIAKLDELGAEQALLASVVDGMQEGLLLVGADRHVRLTNLTLRRILELEFEPEGHALAEVVRHPTVIRDIDRVFLERVEIRESILRLPGSGRSFQLRVSPLDVGRDASPDAVLVLFFDVTRLEKLENVRREFVANVSHELRTPLTAIKAFVENLVDGGIDDPEAARRFLGIVRKHADRMGDLIEDLTDLSLIETGAISLHLAVIDAREVALEVIDILRPQATARNIALDCELPSPFPVRADRRRLVQLLTNLVDNAVKFSEGGSTVRLRGRVESGRAVISVEDEGIGIPAESLEKVFHRFYQTSRDRSGNKAGTGLGLAIVKHLMRLHGGRVRVESELGRGSRFFLEFPPAA